MFLQSILAQACQIANGWPFIIFVIGTAVVCTLAFGFIQLRYFARAWKLMLSPEESKKSAGKKVDMNPVQAFINTLNTSIGNGTIAGTATAVFAGGPGAVLWIMIIGLLLMAVRYAEVYLSIYFSERRAKNDPSVGPMLYLQALPAGKFFSVLYAFICVIFGLVVGNAMQSNSIRLSLQATWNIAPYITAFVLFGFIFYAVIGGAARVVSLSEKIVPFKVALFFVSALALLVYHYQSLLSALQLMVQSAFSPLALAGGAIGFTVQQAMNAGIQRSLGATEAGLGIAGIFFGDTGSKQPVKDSIVSMLSVFVSALICFVVGLVIVASGVWSTGLTSTELTIAAYRTLFGVYGGWMVSFLSVAFGIGVMVSYSYVTREAWLTVTKGKFAAIFTAIYCLFTFGGALISVDLLWNLCNVSNLLMVCINLLGILFLLPLVRRGFQAFLHGKTI